MARKNIVTWAGRESSWMLAGARPVVVDLLSCPSHVRDVLQLDFEQSEMAHTGDKGSSRRPVQSINVCSVIRCRIVNDDGTDKIHEYEPDEVNSVVFRVQA